MKFLPSCCLLLDRKTAQKYDVGREHVYTRLGILQLDLLKGSLASHMPVLFLMLPHKDRKNHSPWLESHLPFNTNRRENMCFGIWRCFFFLPPFSSFSQHNLIFLVVWAQEFSEMILAGRMMHLKIMCVMGHFFCLTTSANAKLFMEITVCVTKHLQSAPIKLCATVWLCMHMINEQNFNRHHERIIS